MRDGDLNPQAQRPKLLGKDAPQEPSPKPASEDGPFAEPASNADWHSPLSPKLPALSLPTLNSHEAHKAFLHKSCVLAICNSKPSMLQPCRVSVASLGSLGVLA